jgi:hypothetical protein
MSKVLAELHNMDLDNAHYCMAKVMDETGWKFCPFCMCVNLADFKGKHKTS